MTSPEEPRCAACGVSFADADALEQHAIEAHPRTRQQVEEDRADMVMAAAIRRERQQEARGRGESAGNAADAHDHRRARMNPARPGEDIGQQTQQQQRQVE